MQTIFGIGSGSGLNDLPGLTGAEWRVIDSPWGPPSDAVVFADYEGLPERFLPRHGRGHRLSPDSIDYRANIDALKRAGVADLVSVSACGSLQEALPRARWSLSISSTTGPRVELFRHGASRACRHGRPR